ncbi:hypothetical protein CSQ92_18505 [Janthinobacterium sp. BJB446]|nr:hypothetical protein CSQ92_18505 [Janthinobacterium sp. BJB446]
MSSICTECLCDQMSKNLLGLVDYHNIVFLACGVKQIWHTIDTNSEVLKCYFFIKIFMVNFIFIEV